MLSALANTATDQVLEWMGVSSGSTLGQIALPIVGFLVVYVVDVGIFLVLLRLLPGVPMPWSDLMQAALVGASRSPTESSAARATRCSHRSRSWSVC